MKTKSLLLLGLAALPLLAAARPATPHPVAKVNPDGTTTMIRLHGDEHFNYITDVDCSTILEEGADGFLRPAMRNGLQLYYDASSVEILRAERQAVEESNLRSVPSPMNAPSRMAALDSDGRTVFHTIGDDIHGLVVLLEYSDTKFSVSDPIASISNMLNEEGYSEYNGKGSARDYYMASSFDQFKPTFDVAPYIVPLPETSAYYVGNNKYQRFREAIYYAINYLEDQGFDFSIYDYDENGIIDNIFFFYAGYGAADSGRSDVIWPHQGSYYGETIIVDGLQMGPYACGNELKGSIPSSRQPYLDGVGTFIHEFGHVLGLPDFYEVTYSGNTETPGNIDVMDSGSYNDDSTRPPLFNTYERWLCNWLEYEIMDEDGLYEIEDLDKSNKGYRLNYTTVAGRDAKNEYFIIESRGKNGWDSAIPDDGIAIWHVRYNSTEWKNNSVNDNGDPRFRIIRPSTTKNQFCWGKDYTTLAPGMSQALKPKEQTAINFNPAFMHMNYDAAERKSTFEFAKNIVSPDDKVVINDSYGKVSEALGVAISWTPIEGATDYWLTVYKISNSGNVLYVNGYNETSIGNVNEYVFNVGTFSNWTATLYITVRAVIDGIPSSKTSDLLVLVPSELDEYAGIEDLWETAGGEAEYYNLQGMKVTNPEKGGIYIRRENGSTRKVVF